MKTRNHHCVHYLLALSILLLPLQSAWAMLDMSACGMVMDSELSSHSTVIKTAPCAHAMVSIDKTVSDDVQCCQDHNCNHCAQVLGFLLPLSTNDFTPPVQFVVSFKEAVDSLFISPDSPPPILS